MRILGAMLGGTISSYNVSGTVKLGQPSFACSYLPENFPSHEFIFPEFETYSSEDATEYKFRDALKQIISEAGRSDFDGILITHGTDTCAFFAQLAVRVLASLEIPFVITGAMRSPDVDPDEAAGNLAFAVKCLEEGKTGVVFKNREGEEQLYKAHLIMSPDIDGIFSEYSDGIEPEKRDCSAFLYGEILNHIQTLPAVPGAEIAPVCFNRVLICCNHSGTASADLAVGIERLTKKGIKCYMAPIPLQGAVYESRKRLRDAGAIELPGMPIEGAWSEVLLR